MNCIAIDVKAICTCTHLVSCQRIVSEAEVEASSLVLNSSRTKAAHDVVDAMLEHSASHERVGFLFTMNMREEEV